MHDKECDHKRGDLDLYGYGCEEIYDEIFMTMIDEIEIEILWWQSWRDSEIRDWDVHGCSSNETRHEDIVALSVEDEVLVRKCKQHSWW